MRCRRTPGQQHNRMFLDLVGSVIHMSVLAAPLLGVTTEVAAYLVSVPTYELRLLGARAYAWFAALFRWRFNAPTFW